VLQKKQYQTNNSDIQPQQKVAKIFSSSVSMQPQKITAHDNRTIPERDQVIIETINSSFLRRHDVPLSSPSRRQKSDPHN
jgi:hypothetical protein